MLPSQHTNPLQAIINHFLQQTDMAEVMNHLQQVCRYDRYQASAGLEKAAELVAGLAKKAALENVTIDYYTANGETQWWNFQAPAAWTPVTAECEIFVNEECILQVNHHEKPFSLATYSAPVNGHTITLVRMEDLANGNHVPGGLALLTQEEFYRFKQPDDWANTGIAGFITDAACRTNINGEQCAGRIELQPGSTLFGFCVTTEQLNRVLSAPVKKANASVKIEIEATAKMPVVSGIIPGESGEPEIWLSAHLCHPRPGANDNASGVAALLAIASVITNGVEKQQMPKPRNTLRFFWGPEFSGTAAILHKQISGSNKYPLANINLDMVGENQAICGGPFIVERTPDCYPSLITPLSEYITGEVFALTAEQGGSWKPVPFMGFSDHALFVNFSYPGISCAAVQFCHTEDPFNHSAADTADKVSSLEMLRSITAAGTLALALSGRSIITPANLQHIVKNWCAQQLQTAAQQAEKFRNPWARGYLEYIQRQNNTMHTLAAAWPVIQNNRAAQSGDGITAHWNGPLNVRAFINGLPQNTRHTIQKLITRNRLNYSLITHFAIRANGKLSRSEIITQTSYTLAQPLPEQDAAIIFDALLEAGLLRLPGKTAPQPETTP
jgi:Peptidase family M28